MGVISDKIKLQDNKCNKQIVLEERKVSGERWKESVLEQLIDE